MKVSIIVPIYNVEPYIQNCLKSVAAQTYTDDVECILVDDCGNDNSVKLAEDFISQYTGNIKFVLLHHKKNSGLSAARNTGIKSAKGEFLYFLDSDDEIIPTCLERLWNLTKKFPEVELVQSSFFRDYSKIDIPNTFPLEYSEDKSYIKEFLLSFDGDIIKAQNRLVKKDLIITNNIFFKEGIIHEDNHWTFFLAKIVTKMAFCNTRTYYHRYNPSSITGNRNVKKEIEAYKTLIEDFCSSIDSFLYGKQKELILETLIYVKHNNLYYNISDYKKLESIFLQRDNYLQRMLFKIMIFSKGKLSTYILHLLIRTYKM